MFTVVFSHVAISIYSIQWPYVRGHSHWIFNCFTEEISWKVEINPADSFFIYPYLIIGLTDFFFPPVDYNAAKVSLLKKKKKMEVEILHSRAKILFPPSKSSFVQYNFLAMLGKCITLQPWKITLSETRSTLQKCQHVKCGRTMILSA